MESKEQIKEIIKKAKFKNKKVNKEDLLKEFEEKAGNKIITK